MFQRVSLRREGGACAPVVVCELKRHLGPFPGVHVFHAGTKKLDDGSIVTDGGRVLAVCAAGDTLASAVELAYRGVDAIEFEGKTVRRDIAHR